MAKKKMKKTTKTARSKPSRQAQVSKGRKDEPESSASGFPIVGIGSSAGGIESFIELLEQLSEDTGMAFVLIQHLSPKHKSSLAEILQRHTKMPVRQAKNDMLVEPNSIYVIPPGERMGIAGDRLSLSHQSETSLKAMPIDFFFRRLAEERGENALAVILSGYDSDGVDGLRYIKARGGFTLAQDPLTARAGEMPNNAIATGYIDKVLPVSRIAAELESLSRHSLVGTKSLDVLEKSAMSQILQTLHTRTGVDFTHYKRGTFNRRLKRRLVVRNASSLGEYVDVLEHDSQECDELFADLLINVTSFFRDPEIFEVLKKKVFRKLFERQPRNSPIRVWVPGCSTGEEAYSIGIALMESMKEHSVRFPVQIFATDISERVLDIARQGFYPEGIVADVPAELLPRFFQKVPGGYCVNQELRELCVFAKHDVTNDPPFSRMDLISCRNLLIYLESALQRRVLNTFAYASNPSGYLLLGTSESIVASDMYFAPADKKVRLYTRKALVGRPRVEMSRTLAAVGRSLAPKRDQQRTAGFEDIVREADQIVLGQYSPAGVIINEQMQIVQFRGSTGEILEHAPGEPDLNLFNMARAGLGQELLVLLKRAKRENAPIIKHGVRFRDRRGVSELTVTVHPLQVHEDTRYSLILFSESSPGKGVRKEAKTGRENGSLAESREELFATREYLQTIISDQEAMNEELKTANEEILSSNEELQSSNEELETAREELQSANEELTTVNEELANRNLQLTRSTNDLTNLLASVDMPIAMVGNDLRIRLFTPKAEQVLNLIPSDIGRPITDIRTRLDITDLDKLICEAIDTMSPLERDVQDSFNRKYSLRVRPYRTQDNRVDGVVLILVDIATRSSEGR